MPTASDTRVPCTVRAKRSRPSSSTPNQCPFASEGAPFSATLPSIDQSISSLDHAARNPPKRAKRVTSASTARLATAARLRRKRVRASCQSERPPGSPPGAPESAMARRARRPKSRGTLQYRIRGSIHA